VWLTFPEPARVFDSLNRPCGLCPQAGIQTYFTSLAELVTSLLEAQQRGQLAAPLQFCTKRELLILHEGGACRSRRAGRTSSSSS